VREWTSRDSPDLECRRQCYEVLERRYNPAFQRHVIDRAVSGQPADDLFWMREPNLKRRDALLSRPNLVQDGCEAILANHVASAESHPVC
jgi:hypothetical protein